MTITTNTVYLVCPSVPPFKTKCPPAPFSSTHLTQQAGSAIFENAKASQPGSLLRLRRLHISLLSEKSFLCIMALNWSGLVCQYLEPPHF